MNPLANHAVALSVAAGLLGLVVGSFLNVLALRSLAEESVFWPPSHCPSCKKNIMPWDNIPVLSYLLLGGRCRFCKCRISWQYPLVEAVTAVAFIVLVNAFGLGWQTLGMAIFVCTLIAVTVTDFREKLIPHDITYPSMLIGIAYSAMVRKDLLGAMAGIGASYIMFDYLAHYGLKLYMHFHADDEAKEGEPDSDDSLDSELGLPGENAAYEQMEVMGGGDAVLSAVIAAYLGWQRLVAALIVGFMVGTVMGVVFLIIEMKKADLLKEVIRPTAAGIIIGFCLLGLSTFLLGATAGAVNQVPWLQFGLMGAAGGALLGIISVGTKVSKPFPFGPALAAGAVAAIFWDPVGSLLSGGA